MELEYFQAHQRAMNGVLALQQEHQDPSIAAEARQQMQALMDLGLRMVRPQLFWDS
jgi:hypothetical protein